MMPAGERSDFFAKNARAHLRWHGDNRGHAWAGVGRRGKLYDWSVEETNCDAFFPIQDRVRREVVGRRRRGWAHACRELR